jgi:hypothetical protein
MPASKSPVTALFGAGADAMTNLYDVRITPPTGITEFSDEASADALTVRAKGFNPPEASAGVYENKYKTATIERVKSTMDFKREFDVEFRLDAPYDLYKFFQRWKQFTNVASTGYVRWKTSMQKSHWCAPNGMPGRRIARS